MKQQSSPTYNTPEASQFSTYLIGLSLLLYPATVLSVKGANGLILVILSIAGLVISYRNKSFFSQPQRHETLLYLSSSLFFILAMILSYNPELEFSGAKKFAHLLLIIPVYIYIREKGIKLAFFWYGLVAGSLLAMSLAWYEVLILQEPRAKSFTHPILFGDLSIAMGMMSLAGIGWFRSKASWQIILPIMAVIAALISSSLAIARGSWAALPFLFVVFFWFYNQSLSKKHKFLIVLTTTVLLLVIYLVPQTQVQNQINRTIENIKIYNNSPIDSELRATSIGGRFEMWQASLTIFKQQPITGIGWGNFQQEVKQQVDAGLRNKFASQFSHPHNQFISALVNGGLIAFLGLLLLLYIPLKQLIAHSRHSENPEINRLALAGLVLIISFIIFGLSEAIFERSRPINFYVFYLAIILGTINHLNNQLQKKSPPRKHSLSVTIITKNEEDRIEDCLKSVHHWADEIIILDSGSDDRTLEIAGLYTDKIFQTDWPGYGIQKQRALEKASCEWVLSIDADERLTPELRHAIDCVLSQQTPKHNGYKTPWAVMLYGHRMDFGRSARAPLRLFVREGSQFTDSAIHERVVLPEPQSTGKLNGRLLHFTHRDYGHGIRKAGDYAWLSSQKYYRENRWGGGLIGATLRSCWTFVLIYILRLGILDGAAGFVSAVNYSQNSFNKYAGLWSLRRERKN